MTDEQRAMATFDEAVAAHPAPTIEPATDPVKTDGPKVEPRKMEESKKTEADTQEFPDEVLLGKAPENKPEENPDAIFDEAPKGPVKHEHFAKVQQTAKERVAAVKAEADALKAELESLRSRATQPNEDHEKTVTELRREITEHREELSRVAFEKHDPEYNKAIRVQESNKGLAVAAAKAAGVDEKLVETAFRLGGPQGLSILREAEVETSTLTYVAGLLAQNDQQEASKAEMAKNSRDILSARQQQAQAQAAAKEAHIQKIETATFARVRAEMEKHPELQPLPGHDRWNGQLQNFHNRAQEVLDFRSDNLEETSEFVARNAYAVARSELNETLNKMLRDKCNALIQENASLKGGSPHINGGGNQTKTGGPDLSKMTDEERSKAIFEEAINNPRNRA